MKKIENNKIIPLKSLVQNSVLPTVKQRPDWLGESPTATGMLSAKHENITQVSDSYTWAFFFFLNLGRLPFIIGDCRYLNISKFEWKNMYNDQGIQTVRFIRKRGIHFAFLRLFFVLFLRFEFLLFRSGISKLLL